MKATDRIAALEAEIAAERAKSAAFEARLSALEPKRARAPAVPPPREGTTVTILAPVSTFIMPDRRELLKIADTVRGGNPKFLFSDSAFASSFRVAGYFRRTKVPNKKYYFEHWLDESEAILRQWGDNTEISGTALLAAIIGHHDIAFSDWTQDGTTLEVGLDSYTGRPATDAWRKTLAGELPKPIGSRALMSPQMTIGRVWRLRGNSTSAR